MTKKAPSCPTSALSAAIGRTPLARLRLRHRGRAVEVYAKAEMSNLSGSIKDRMVISILRRAYAEGRLMPGQPIAEATSGNAGIALAAIGGALRHPVTIFMPDWMSEERRRLLTSHGAQVCLVSAAEGGFRGAIAKAEELGQHGFFLPRQFSNPDNPLAHRDETMPELWEQMAQVGVRPTGFVAGVGTGGTVMGAAQFLRARDTSCPVHPVEPASSPTLSTGYKVGQHRMQGISDEFVPDIVRLEQLDRVIAVHDGDAILMAQRIGRELGLGIGISSGGNILAAVIAAGLQSGTPRIATVLADGHMKYLSTDLMRAEPVQADYLTPHIDFEGIDLLPATDPILTLQAA